MNKLLASAILGSLITSAAVQADAIDPTDLEPAMNGGVSSSGQYPTQALEDRFGVYDATDLEPAMNGSVSASGLYPSQEIEDAVARR